MTFVYSTRFIDSCGWYDHTILTRFLSISFGLSPEAGPISDCWSVMCAQHPCDLEGDARQWSADSNLDSKALILRRYSVLYDDDFDDSGRPTYSPYNTTKGMLWIAHTRLKTQN